MGKLNTILERMGMTLSDDERGSAALCTMGSLFIAFIFSLFLGIIWSSGGAGTETLKLMLVIAIVISVFLGLSSAAYRYMHGRG